VTPLERALRQRIAAEGPISVEAYMEACNSYYYSTRDPLGSDGDFTTAPEISQMFGELIGAALTDCWQRAGAPADAIYVELGPGRGSLAADALRVMNRAGFNPQVHLIEISPRLREVQAKSLGPPLATWHDSLATLPAGRPMLLVANEFFDALPVRQFIGAKERMVVLTPAGLAFDRDGEIIEDSPSRDAVAGEIGSQLNDRGGVAIVIDYGHERTAPGDTLQAVRGHRYAAVLHSPGEQDLTSHVDFEALAGSAALGKASVSRLATQGEWLIRLGIDARARALSVANPERAREVQAGLERLTSASGMGRLFKVLAIHAQDWPAPAGLQ
jgi:SAM-dependent MidA family methyltransferase